MYDIFNKQSVLYNSSICKTKTPHAFAWQVHAQHNVFIYLHIPWTIRDISFRDMLKQGGSAVDGAIAALLCTSLVNPQSMGLGGGSIFTVMDSSGDIHSTLLCVCVPWWRPTLIDNISSFQRQRENHQLQRDCAGDYKDWPAEIMSQDFPATFRYRSGIKHHQRPLLSSDCFSGSISVPFHSDCCVRYIDRASVSCVRKPG